MEPDDTEVLEGEVIPSSQVRQQGNNPSMALAKLLENPGGLQGLFNLNDAQSENVMMVAAMGGAGLGFKFGRKYVGDYLSTAAGSLAAVWLARKLMGVK